MEIPGFRGSVVEPGHESYDQARAIWNGAIDRRPAAIARCTGTADVIAAVRHARERDLAVSVRGGGHGVGGPAVVDGGLVIDCAPMRGIRVDPAARTARAQAGVLLGELDHETQAFGLAVPAGVVTTTGLAGLTLGGGIGWLMRKHGLTIDNLLSVDLVTAGGEFVRAGADENADLFWGVRGGGGNFGVVTSFGFRAHAVGPTVLAGPVFWALEEAPDVLRFYRDFIASVPDEFTSVLNLRRAPAVPFLPEELHGRHVLGIAMCWCGPIDAGEAALRPLRSFGSPLIDLLRPKPFLAHQSMFDVTVPAGWSYYWKSSEIGPLSDGSIDLLVSNTFKISSPKSYTVVFQLGGAISDVAEDATAYSHRDAAHNVNINGVWEAGDPQADEHVAWTRRFFEELEPYQAGVYVNFLGEEGPARVRAAYGDAKYGRLVDLKTKYDPDNFFRLNQNIEPRR